MGFKERLKSIVGVGQKYEFNADEFIEDLKSFKKWGYEIPPEMKNNKDFMLSAISVRRSCFEYISEELHKDKDFICKVVKGGYCYLHELSEEMLADKDVALASTNKYRNCLDGLNPKFKDDKDVVMKAVGKYPENITHASSRLLADKDVALEAITASASLIDFTTVFCHVADALTQDKKFAIDAVGRKVEALEYMPEMNKDEDVLMAGAKDFNDPDKCEKLSNKAWFKEAQKNYGVIKARFDREAELHQRLEQLEKDRVQQQSSSQTQNNTQRAQVKRKI